MTDEDFPTYAFPKHYLRIKEAVKVLTGHDRVCQAEIEGRSKWVFNNSGYGYAVINSREPNEFGDGVTVGKE